MLPHFSYLLTKCLRSHGPFPFATILSYLAQVFLNICTEDRSKPVLLRFVEGQREAPSSVLSVWHPTFLPPPLPLPGTAHPRYPPAGLDFLPSVETKGEAQVTDTGDVSYSTLGRGRSLPSRKVYLQCFSGQEIVNNHSQHKAQAVHHPVSLRAGTSLHTMA